MRDQEQPDEDLAILLQRVSAKDGRAFELLYQRTSGKLYGVALRILNSTAATDEVLQEAFVKIWKNAGRYDASIGKPISWMCVIARNQALDRLRARKPVAADIDDDAINIADDGPDPEYSTVLSGEMDRVAACMSELKDDHASVLRRTYLEGWSYQEAADEVNAPLNTVKTWIRRSLIKLRDCMNR